MSDMYKNLQSIAQERNLDNVSKILKKAQYSLSLDNMAQKIIDSLDNITAANLKALFNKDVYSNLNPQDFRLNVNQLQNNLNAFNPNIANKIKEYVELSKQMPQVESKEFGLSSQPQPSVQPIAPKPAPKPIVKRPVTTQKMPHNTSLEAAVTQEAVKILQQRANVNDDGKYGQTTHNAVLAFLNNTGKDPKSFGLNESYRSMTPKAFAVISGLLYNLQQQATSPNYYRPSPSLAITEYFTPQAARQLSAILGTQYIDPRPQISANEKKLNDLYRAGKLPQPLASEFYKYLDVKKQELKP